MCKELQGKFDGSVIAYFVHVLSCINVSLLLHGPTAVKCFAFTLTTLPMHCKSNDVLYSQLPTMELGHDVKKGFYEHCNIINYKGGEC